MRLPMDAVGGSLDGEAAHPLSQGNIFLKHHGMHALRMLPGERDRGLAHPIVGGPLGILMGIQLLLGLIVAIFA